MMRLGLLGLVLAGVCGLVAAEPVKVVHMQGTTRGFLTLRDADGKRIAYGDVIQNVRGSRVTARVTFHFRDGSVDDDTTVYTEAGTFRMVSDHHVQRGPRFAKPVDAFVDVAAQTVTMRSVDKDGKAKVEVQKVELPDDVSNGMALTLLCNKRFAAGPSRLSYVTASATKARVVRLAVGPAGMEDVVVAGQVRKAEHYVLRIELGGVAGVIAPIIGKQPDDVEAWILPGEAPVMVAERGQMYEGGPVWTVELAGTELPREEAATAKK